VDSEHPKVTEWLARASLLEAWGDPTLARFWTLAASELADSERERVLERLTIAQAAQESGYSRDHLSRLLADGRLENVGNDGAPRIRRSDLPRKARLRSTEPDLVGKVLGAEADSR